MAVVFARLTARIRSFLSPINRVYVNIIVMGNNLLLALVKFYSIAMLDFRKIADLYGFSDAIYLIVVNIDSHVCDQILI